MIPMHTVIQSWATASAMMTSYQLVVVLVVHVFRTTAMELCVQIPTKSVIQIQELAFVSLHTLILHRPLAVLAVLESLHSVKFSEDLE
jgi:hypothetical protein